MKHALRQSLATPLSLVLAFPAAYFLVICILKYTFNVDMPYDASWPLLERLGIKESPGININSLILFGPVIAILMNTLQVLSIDKRFTKDHLHFHVRIRKKWFPIAVMGFSVFLLTVLFIYMFLENCLLK